MTTIPNGEVGAPAQFDPFDRQVLDDPFPVWARYRESSPVFWSEATSAWVVTQHALLEEVFRDPERFPSGGLARAQEPPPEISAILSAIDHVEPLRATDAPDHGRQRRPTLAAVSPRRVARMEPDVREIAHGLVDAVAGRGHADFYRDFAYPFPLQVISRLLGLADADGEQLHHWAACRVQLAWGQLSMRELRLAAHGMVEFHDFMKAQVFERTERPRDDGLSDFVAAARAADEPMSIAEIVEQAIALVTGGHETTANWLSLSMWHLLDPAERWAALVRGRTTPADVVEETLRYDSAVRAVWRRAAGDTVLGGVPIGAGERLYCVIGSANRDPAAFADPDTYAPGRADARGHLTFGRGVHFCIGASLSRLEGRVALGVLAERLPGLRLASARLRCEANATLRIVTGLDLDWDLTPRR